MPGPEVPAGTAIAWVESPFQLIGALEAHAAGLLAEQLLVTPRAGVEPLAVTVSELRRLGLPPRVRVGRPAGSPPRRAQLLAIGDAFSGEVQRLLAASPPRRTVLLDDGRATRRMLDALLRHDVPLLRPHVPASAARTVLARFALGRLHRLAGHGRVRVVTALDVPDALRADSASAGISLARHDFGWLRSLPPAGPAQPAGVVVLGTSMVANELIAAEPYLDWVRSIRRSAAGTPVVYRAHRREDDRTLRPLADAGVDVREGALPVELSLRALRPDQEIVTLPTTAASTLRMLNPDTRIREFAVPEGWWRPGVPAAARQRLAPELSSGPADRWRRCEIGWLAAAG